MFANSLISHKCLLLFMLWTRKHQPTLEYIPHDTSQIERFVLEHKKQKKKALLVHGAPGTGKTSTVHAIAQKHNLELIEINASDFRNADKINEKVGNALKQQSLFSQGKLILVDEVDGIAGREDRGGAAALAKLIQHGQYPIILTANDPWHKKFNTIRNKSQLVELKTPEPASLVPVLKRILDKENIPADENLLKTLARRSGGDIRGAITDLQILAHANQLTKDGLNGLDEREKSESIMQALIKILKATDPKLALGALDSVNVDLDEGLLWIDENLPSEYKQPADLARAYDALSKADVYRGRIRKWQYWRYLVYVNALMTAGVAVAKDKKSPAFVSYKRTQRILKLWIAKQKNAKRTAIAEKVAEATHTSARQAVQDTIPYLQILYKEKHPSVAAINEELGLEDDEIEWLAK